MTEKDYKLYGTKILNLKTQEFEKPDETNILEMSEENLKDEKLKKFFDYPIFDSINISFYILLSFV